MRKNRRTWLVAAGAAATMAALTACGGGTASAEHASAPHGPVTVQWWGWNQGQQAQADLFNKTHTDIQVAYKQQAGIDETQTAMQNAVKAGSGVACVVQTNGETTASYVSDGTIVPITKYFKQDESKYSKAAWNSVKLGSDIYGVPFNANPTFLLVNKAVYAQEGIAAPKTWEDMIADGKKVSSKGISIVNYAGEDPSTLTQLAMQAGARWYQIDGDSWKIGFNSPESKKAGAIAQQFIDNNLVSHETFAQWDALMQKFDSGTMISIPTSTWQMAAYGQNFKKSLGNWQAVDLPQFAGSDFVTPSGYQSYVVPKGCHTIPQAVEFANWLATDPASIKLAADPKSGSGLFPTVADPSPYISTLMDTTMLGSNAGGAADVVTKANDATLSGWVYGPDWATVSQELADQWGKAVAKQQTVDHVLEHMQQFTVADLKKRGISVSK